MILSENCQIGSLIYCTKTRTKKIKAKETKENKTDIAQRFKRTSRRVSSQDKTFRMYGTERCYGVYKCASVTHAQQVDGSGYIVSVDRHLELVGRLRVSAAGRAAWRGVRRWAVGTRRTVHW